MVSCESCREIIAAGEEATPAAAAAVRAHLVVCEECAALARGLDAVAAAYAAVEPAPAGFAARVLARLPLRAGAARRRGIPGWLGVAAFGFLTAGAAAAAWRAYASESSWGTTLTDVADGLATAAYGSMGLAGALAAAAAALAVAAYYFLVPSE
jgi:hypothetical protein